MRWNSIQPDIAELQEFNPVYIEVRWLSYLSPWRRLTRVGTGPGTANMKHLPPLSKALIVKGKHTSLEQCSLVWHHCSDPQFYMCVCLLSSCFFPLWALVLWFSLSPVSETNEWTEKCDSCTANSSICIGVCTGTFITSCTQPAPSPCACCEWVFVCYVGRDCAPVLPWVEESTSSGFDHLAGQSVWVCVCVCVTSL